MNENKNKIKNLPKIVSNQLRLSFTAFFLVSLAHSSQLFASDTDRLTQRLLDVEEGRGSTGVSTRHSLNADRSPSDEGLAAGFALSSPVHISPELRGDAAAEEEDLYAAIDDVHESFVREVTTSRGRARELLRRGARSVKKMLKGISSRNPFTSK